MRIYFIILFLISNTCLAQNNERKIDIRYELTGMIVRHMDRDLFMSTPPKHAYYFSITLSFDAKGEIDTILFSKYRDSLTFKVMGLNNKLIQAIKNIGPKYKKFHSKLVVIPFLWYDWEKDSILLNNQLLKSIEGFMPAIDGRLKDKQLIILDPMLNQYSKPKS